MQFWEVDHVFFSSRPVFGGRIGFCGMLVGSASAPHSPSLCSVLWASALIFGVPHTRGICHRQHVGCDVLGSTDRTQKHHRCQRVAVASMLIFRLLPTPRAHTSRKPMRIGMLLHQTAEALGVEPSEIHGLKPIAHASGTERARVIGKRKADRKVDALEKRTHRIVHLVKIRGALDTRAL